MNIVIQGYQVITATIFYHMIVGITDCLILFHPGWDHH